MDKAGDRRGSDAAQHQAFVRHELRTPIAVMRPALDVLLDGGAGPLNDKQLAYVRMIDRNVARLSGMIGSVVESGWLELSALPATETEVDVRELVEATVEDVRASVEGCPRLTREIDDQLPPVRGDRGRLGYALRNVVVNACVYTRLPGHVRVTAARCVSSARIIVEDTGCGIAPEDLPRVFEFGFQGSAGREREVRGLGMGLFVTREVVERHGGRISIESLPGPGTRATLELPARAP